MKSTIYVSMAETRPLEYYYVDGNYATFNKYTIDNTGIVQNKKTGKELSYKLLNGYYIVGVQNDDGKQCHISVARAVASAFLGKPPTLQHTVDHIVSNQKLNNAISNIRWASKSEQIVNRTITDTNKSAFIIMKDKHEMTAREWVIRLKDTNNPFGRTYTVSMIKKYAQKKQHGFSYKEYLNLEGEVWKEIKNSKNNKGHWWEISDKSRMKYITNHASNVLYGDRLRLVNGYPTISINGKHMSCHILSYEAFYPDIARGDLMILHKHDDKSDFSPQNLRLGSASENSSDAHNNGKYNGTKSARKRCASYIDGILEKEHDSMSAAVEYLQDNGHKKAKKSAISMALAGILKSAYGRTWNLFI